MGGEGADGGIKGTETTRGAIELNRIFLFSRRERFSELALSQRAVFFVFCFPSSSAGSWLQRRVNFLEGHLRRRWFNGKKRKRRMLIMMRRLFRDDSIDKHFFSTSRARSFAKKKGFCGDACCRKCRRNGIKQTTRRWVRSLMAVKPERCLLVFVVSRAAT